MAELVFDRATHDDIEELIELRIAYMWDDFGNVTPEEEAAMRSQLPDYFSRELGKKLIAFVARDEGKIVATAYLLIIEIPANPVLPNGLEGDVLSVFTRKEYRGRGICTRLMKDLIACAKEMGLCRIDLKATEEGSPIYRKVGFKDKTQKYTDLRLEL